jgi:hypothetical protein
MRKTKNATIKIKKSTFAIPAAAAEIPVKPNRPAMIETIRKKMANLSILSSADGSRSGWKTARRLLRSAHGRTY